MADLKTAVAYRGGGFRPRILPIVALISFVGSVALLEVFCRTGVIGPLSFPSPSSIGKALGELYKSGLLYQHLSASLSRLAIGWSLGVSCGIIAGFVIGISTIGRSVGIPWVAGVSAIP